MPELPPIPPDLPNELDMWIHIATSGCDAQERAWLRQELTVRFQNALAEMVAGGLAPPRAARTFLQFLGEPITENEELRKMLRAAGTSNQRAMRDWVEQVFPSTPSALLSIWLRTATRGLCDAARERIGQEILAHYEDALADALERGLPQAEAQRQAILSLGSATEASEHFVRTYLSQGEDARLLALRKAYEGPRQSISFSALRFFTLGFALNAFVFQSRYLWLFYIFWIELHMYLCQYLRARLFFDRQTHHPVRRYVATMLPFWLTWGIGWELLHWILAFFKHAPIYQYPSVMNSGWQGWVILMSVTLLLICYDFSIYIPLLKKSWGMKPSEFQLGPDQHA